MSLRLLRRQFSKIAVVAGSSASDARGAQVVQSLRRVNPNATFFGVAGPKMEAEGVEANVRAADLPQKWVFPLKNYRVDPRFILSLYMIPEQIRMFPALLRLWLFGFWRPFANATPKDDVDMVVTLDNDLLGHRINELRNLLFTAKSDIQPLRVHFGLTVRNMTYKDLKTLDYLFYSLPVKSVDKEKFNFPSQFVGVQAVYDTLRFVMEASPDFQARVHPTHLTVDTETLFEMVRRFQVTRKQFYRERLGLAENSWVFFFRPGNNDRDISHHAKVIRDALLQISGRIPSNHQMVALINLPGGPSEQNKLPEYFKGMEALVRFVYDDEPVAKLEALAASNYAAVDGSETTFQAATLQIPTVILDNTTSAQGYVTLLHNVHSAAINFGIEGELFPELILRDFGSKLVEFLEEYIHRPERKAEVARRFYRRLPDFLPQDDDLRFPFQAPDKLSKTDLRLYNPAFVTDQTLQRIYAEFRALKERNLPLPEKESKRRELILGPE